MDETKYLGVLFSKCRKFFCDWHPNRRKFYKATNAILGSLGSKPDIDLALYLCKSICIPKLLYGVAAFDLSPREMSSFTFVYNSIFVKLFGKMNSETIGLCQYYCNMLPFTCLYDLTRIKFLLNCLHTLNANIHHSHALHLRTPLQVLCAKYHFPINASPAFVYWKIWSYFENSICSFK